MIGCYDPECTCRQCDGSDSDGPTLADVAIDDVEDICWQMWQYDQAIADYDTRVIHHAQYLIDSGRVADGVALLLPFVATLTAGDR